MSNTLTPSSPTYWSKRMQMVHHKRDVYRATANFEERATLNDGQTVDRPYKSGINVQDYAKDTSVTIQDIDSTSQTLTVNQFKIAPFYVDSIDALQNKYNTVNEFADDAAKKLGNEIDGDYNAEYSNATSDVDLQDMTGAGTAGEGFTVDVSNVLKMFSVANRKLDALNIDRDGRFANISPHILQVVQEYLAGKDSMLGDKTSLNGHQGKFMGFDLHLSNQLAFSTRLGLATAPTATDTVVLGGVTFTFVSTIGATAGNVLIDTTAANSNTHLAALINAPGTTTANGVALSAADQETVRRWTATAAATYTDIVAKGVSYLVASDTLTDATDKWTLDLQLQHNLFGQKGAIDLVIQKMPNVEFRDVETKLGRNVLPWTIYGIKTFNEGADKIVDIKVRSDGF